MKAVKGLLFVIEAFLVITAFVTGFVKLDTTTVCVLLFAIYLSGLRNGLKS